MKKAIIMVGNFTEDVTQGVLPDGQWMFAHSVEDAIEKFQQSNVDVIVLHHELNTTDKNKLIAVARFQEEDTEIINLAKESSLKAALEQALQEQAHKQKAHYTIKDDALKYASYNIQVENPDYNN